MPPEAADVDRFLAEVEVESARLQEQIRAAKARGERARAAGASPAEVRMELDALVAGAQHALDRMEREHREAIRTVAAAAWTESQRVLAEARAEVVSMRAASANPGTVTGHAGSTWAATDPRR